MLSQEQLLRFGQEHLFLNYRQPPLVITRGEGSWLFDMAGRKYLDLSGGIAVMALGHCHPRISAVISKQAQQLAHISNLFYNDKANALAEELCKRSFGERVFFCNSGAEANEAAIKLARRYYYDRKEPRYEIISAKHSFHGRTLATVAATGQPKYHEGFGPMPEGFKHVAYGDLRALEEAITDSTALVMLEPMQGEGGVVLPPQGYLRSVRELCNQKGVLLHFDEVQVGMGRTGKWFCHEHDNVIPNTMSLAKALGAGLPIGALVSTHQISQSLVPGTHASTFGGNPIACAAALAFIAVVEEENLLARATQVGNHATHKLTRALSAVSFVKEVRGRGCLIGVEFEGKTARQFVDAMRAKNVFATIAAENVLRLAPAFNIPMAELDMGLDVLIDAVQTA